VNTHTVQIALAIVVAVAGAAVPFIVQPMTPTAWLLLVAAVASAIGKALSVQSEIAGDKKATATAAAATAAANTNAQKGFSVLGAIVSLAILGAILTVGVLLNGCNLPAQTAQAIEVASVNLGQCVESVIVKDESATPPVSATQLILDEGTTCSSEAIALLEALGETVTTANEANVVAQAHSLAIARRAGKGR
jgi:hypothetical protein